MYATSTQFSLFCFTCCAGLLVLPPALLTQRLAATLDLLQLPPEAGKGLVLRVPGVLLQPPGVTRSHVLGLSAVLNIPLVRVCGVYVECARDVHKSTPAVMGSGVMCVSAATPMVAVKRSVALMNR